MGRTSQRKGGRVEREIVALHKDMGVYAERVPLSGDSRYRGNGADVDVYARGKEEAPFVAEVKARKNGNGFTTLETCSPTMIVCFSNGIMRSHSSYCRVGYGAVCCSDHEPTRKSRRDGAALRPDREIDSREAR